MTVYEHAMVGIDGALAAGLHRRYGWQIIAWAGIAALLPDWDALTILLGSQCFSEAHRLWGHNLLVAGLLAAALSAVVYRWDILAKIQRGLAKRWKMFGLQEDASTPPTRSAQALWLWILVGITASYSHLLMDTVCSGNRNLPTWAVPWFWPFSAAAWAYPMLPWGNAGATVIFALGMFAMVFASKSVSNPVRNRRSISLQAIAIATLLAVAAYMVVWKVLFPNG
jgi:membrane-bound metal-dependent hydrolase YbcI (DUF457 family)